MASLALIALTLMSTTAQSPATVKPDPRHLPWHKMEYYGFVHFGPNTFTDKEWGEGREDPKVFNPTQMDPRQWARTFKQAGMKGVIITAKHHDGFCLWPSKYSTHTVAQASVKRDILKELSEACKAEGLKFGVYLSPWDRNHPSYGTPEYNQVFAKMLEEVLTQYGEVFEVWFDGANGEGPNGKKQVYDWKLFESVVRKHQPKAVIFSDAGDVRWVGNERGIAPETSWSMLKKDRYVPGTPLHAELGEGQRDGTHWAPTESDVSIRPGWFYHASQDGQVKTPEQLLDIWTKSVGRNSNLLLNVPPDRRGLIHENDVAALIGFRKLREETYTKDLAGGKAAFAKPIEFDRIDLREDIRQGQSVAKFRVEAEVDGKWSKLAEGTTIGNRRILPVEPVKATGVRVVVEDRNAPPALLPIRLFASPDVKRTYLRESKADRDKRMAWFRDARFGMFIHWGLYAIPGGEWKGKNYPGAGEWLMNTAQIPKADYMPLINSFNPVKYDPKEWVRIAKNAGMKYIVITSKHHEGFALWPSKHGDFDIENTPYRKDLLKPLAEACKEAGIKLCFYHSILDWTHPDYLPKRGWDRGGEAQASFPKYVEHMKGQLKELLTNYGDIGIVWFDGEWESSWTHEQGKDLYQYVRKLQPNTIVNNRVDKGRAGMQGMTQGAHFAGDYGTPEQEIPGNGLPGIDWESCMTMNGSWGFHQHDHNWKSVETLIKNLIDCASKGGNYLLNVGPTAEGEIPAASVERLAGVGTWMRRNSEAIYGTTAGPFSRPTTWGRVTQKPGRMFLHLFDATPRTLELRGLKANVQSIRLLENRTKTISFTNGDRGLQVQIPDNLPGPIPVLEVLVSGSVSATDPGIEAAANGAWNLKSEEAVVQGHSARYEDTHSAIGYWTSRDDKVVWNLDVEQRGDFEVEVEYACEPGSAGSDFVVEVGGTTLKGKVAATKGWGDFVKVRLGKASLVTVGRQTVVVRATSMPNGAVMNLRAVRLIP